MKTFSLLVARPHGLRTALASLLLLLGGCSSEADRTRTESSIGYPGCSAVAGETVRWIVPFSPGGGFDVLSRLLEPFYERSIGAEIVVQNRVGAAGRIGTRVVRDADPDGRTLGLVNAYSLLVAGLTGEVEGFHPTEDFTALGRVGPSYPVWFVAPESRFRSIDELLNASDDQPLLVGMTDVGSTGFASTSVGADLLGLRIAYLAGYPGSREVSMGLIRGEFDLMSATFESLLDRVQAGDLTPILQISDAPYSDHPLLTDVPHLGGPDGVAARVARQRGGDVQQTLRLASALSDLFSAGRLVVAPPGVEPELARCLSTGLERVMSDSAFVQAAARAERGLAFQGPAPLAAQLEATRSDRLLLRPMLLRHAEIARSGDVR